MNIKRPSSPARVAATQASKNGVAGAQSIHRATAILRAVASRGRDGARLVDVARQCELDKSTAHRILKCLAADGMVSHDPDTRCYLLGELAFELGLVAVPKFNMRQLCEPALLRLAKRTGDTVFLSVRSGLDSVCMDRKEGSFPIKVFTLDVGTRRPLGMGADGLALLLPLADDEATEIVRSNARRIADHGNLKASAVLDMLKRSRALGFALNDRHTASEAIALGLAITRPHGGAYGAISIGAIASRMSPERVREVAALLKTEVRALEKALSSGKARFKPAI